ncbi:HNH endonuclease signature motif containing protein [Duganella sp. LjRoot269]
MMARLQTLKTRIGSAPARLATIQPGSWRTDKTSSTARGYGYKWQQARAGYLVLHPFCAYCLREVGISYDQDAVTIGLQCTRAGIGLPYAQVVDHVEPHRGDMKLFWDSTNWQSLCSTHHSRDKQREEAEG